MRNRVSHRIPHVRFSHIPVALAMMLALSGCGGGSSSSGGAGGGGGGGGGGGATTTAALSGTVRDSLNNPIRNALVGVVGTSLQTRTATDGTFTIFNVPLTSTRFTANSPDLTAYFDIAQYQGGRPYDVDPARPGGQCTLPLPTLTAGAVTLPATVFLFAVSAGPPPPPSGTCP